MQTHTIPPENWASYFAQLSRDHAGWPITIELSGQNGAQRLATQLEFQGISFDTKGSRPSTLEVSAGDGGGPHIAHTIDLPLHIREVADRRGSLHLLIEPASGPPTVLHLRMPTQ